MALDSFDRVAALNAVLQAWTQYDSNEFITHVTLSPGESKSYEFTDPASFIRISFGPAANLIGMNLYRFENGASYAKAVVSASDTAFTRSGNVFTIKNNNASAACDFYIITLSGGIEEV